MTVKAGQKCTAIRRALVPAGRADDVLAALQDRARQGHRGRSAPGGGAHGPGSLPEPAPRGPGTAREAASARRTWSSAIPPRRSRSGPMPIAAHSSPRRSFIAATPRRARAIHSVEAFGPVCTLVPYASGEEAIELARRGGGSLAGSVFSADDEVAAQLVLGTRPLSRAHRGGEPALRQGIHRPRLPAAPPGARRSGARRRRRGDGRHPRRHALPAAHRDPGHPGPDYRRDRALDPRFTPARSRGAPVSQALRGA